MDSLSLSQALATMLSTAYYLFIHGGWVLVVLVLIMAARYIHLDRLQTAFIKSNEQVFLHVKVPRENEVSLRSIEALFSQLHAIHTNFSWMEKNLEGRVNLWVSFEIVSLGGKISYIIRTPQRYVHLLESAIYAHYPAAEISEVEDYMKNLQHWTPESDWDLWGCEYMQRDFAYPIRTYKDFEHMAAEDKIIDPLAGMLEALGKMEPWEMFGIQIVCRPIADAEWQPHAKDVVAKLKGEPIHKESVIDKMMAPLNMLGEKHLIEMLTEKKMVMHGDQQVAPMFRLTDVERLIITAVENKASKVGYETKIRTIYIAPKDKFDGNKKTSIVGGFRILSGLVTNNFKPDLKHTWTRYDYVISRKLEKPIADLVTNTKKHHMLSGYVSRSMWIGAPPMILNVEELATLYHFPMISVSVPPVERIDVKKGQPPSDLPIFS